MESRLRKKAGLFFIADLPTIALATVGGRDYKWIVGINIINKKGK